MTLVEIAGQIYPAEIVGEFIYVFSDTEEDAQQLGRLLRL